MLDIFLLASLTNYCRLKTVISLIPVCCVFASHCHCSDSVLVPCRVPYQRCVCVRVCMCVCGCSYTVRAQLPAALKNIRCYPRMFGKFLCSCESCKCTDYDILSYKLWPHGYVMWRWCYQSDKWYNKRFKTKNIVQQTWDHSKGCCCTPESDAPDSMPHLDQHNIEWSWVKRWNLRMSYGTGILKRGTCQNITFSMAVYSSLPAVF